MDSLQASRISGGNSATGPIGKLGALPRCPKCGAYHLMWDPETDISKCRCCGYENIEEARQNFEKQLKRGERSADEAKAYTIRKENAVPFTVDKPADDEWLKMHAEDMKKMLKSSAVMGSIYADIDKQAAIIRTKLEDRILCEWQLNRADVEDALRERDAYRATGLTPEGVKKLKEERLDTRGAMLLGQLMAVELKHVNRKRLKELIEADRDGRVAIFPCKQDDYLWHWREPDILGPSCYRVTDISYLNGQTVLNTNLLEVIDARRIGDDFFLTEAEARKARAEGRV